MARRLADAVTDVPGLRLSHPVQANAVFARLGLEQATALRSWNFHVWAGDEDRDCTVRWMTAFNTSEADVDEFVAAIRATATAPASAAS
jgi:threonine aldolase